MSRVLRYQESIKRFINDRMCYNDIQKNNINMYNIIINELVDKEYIFPILTLTIMNNRTKKNNQVYQGYYAAVCIECIRNIYQNINKLNYNKLNETMIILALKLWNQNIFLIKKKLSNDKILKLFYQYNDYIYDKISKMLLETEKKYEEVMRSDIHRSYLNKIDIKLRNNFLNLKHQTEESLNNNIKNNICQLSELALILGWLIGGGSEFYLSKLAKIAENFGFMYKISYDFKNLKKDIETINTNISDNYVLNRGIQASFEKFNELKDKFIEEAMLLEILSPTVNEIINILENNVNTTIDETNPDFKSTYSTIA